MTFRRFLAHLPGGIAEKRSEETLRVFHAIFCHVAKEGQTTRFDEKLKTAVGKVKNLSSDAIQKHLRTLQQGGLIDGHQIVRKASMVERHFGLGFSFVFNSGPPPGKFLVYTLPGMKADMVRLSKK